MQHLAWMQLEAQCGWHGRCCREHEPQIMPDGPFTSAVKCLGGCCRSVDEQVAANAAAAACTHTAVADVCALFSPEKKTMWLSHFTMYPGISTFRHTVLLTIIGTYKVQVHNAEYLLKKNESSKTFICYLCFMWKVKKVSKSFLKSAVLQHWFYRSIRHWMERSMIFF